MKFIIFLILFHIQIFLYSLISTTYIESFLPWNRFPWKCSSMKSSSMEMFLHGIVFHGNVPPWNRFPWKCSSMESSSMEMFLHGIVFHGSFSSMKSSSMEVFSMQYFPKEVFFQDPSNFPEGDFTNLPSSVTTCRLCNCCCWEFCLVDHLSGLIRSRTTLAWWYTVPRAPITPRHWSWALWIPVAQALNAVSTRFLQVCI